VKYEPEIFRALKSWQEEKSKSPRKGKEAKRKRRIIH